MNDIDLDIQSLYPLLITVNNIVKPTGLIVRIYEGQEAYCVELSELPNPGIVDWCRQQYGTESTDRWFTVNNVIVFENEEDRTWFILKWSS